MIRINNWRTTIKLLIKMIFVDKNRLKNLLLKLSFNFLQLIEIIITNTEMKLLNIMIMIISIQIDRELDKEFGLIDNILEDN
jgi:hypothetical protein